MASQTLQTTYATGVTFSVSMLHSNVVGDKVVMENKLIRSQLPGDWPAYEQVRASIPVHCSDAQAPCTLLPPNAQVHMIYVSSQGQCYVVEKDDAAQRCYYRFLRAEYWLHADTPKNSLFAAIEFKNNDNAIVLGFFDVLVLNKQTLQHEHVFARVQKLHELLFKHMQCNANICFHFVGQQDSVLQHLCQHKDHLQGYSAVQFQQHNSQRLALMPLLLQEEGMSSRSSPM